MKCVLEATKIGHFVEGRGTMLTATANPTESFSITISFVEEDGEGLKKLRDPEVQRRLKAELIDRFDQALEEQPLI